VTGESVNSASKTAETPLVPFGGHRHRSGRSHVAGLTDSFALLTYPLSVNFLRGIPRRQPASQPAKGHSPRPPWMATLSPRATPPKDQQRAFHHHHQQLQLQQQQQREGALGCRQQGIGSSSSSGTSNAAMSPPPTATTRTSSAISAGGGTAAAGGNPFSAPAPPRPTQSVVSSPSCITGSGGTASSRSTFRLQPHPNPIPRVVRPGGHPDQVLYEPHRAGSNLSAEQAKKVPNPAKIVKGKYATSVDERGYISGKNPPL